MNEKKYSQSIHKTFAGVFLYIFLYILFVVIFQYFVQADCLHQPCNSEGIDNTSIGWATDFYISLCMFAMGYHLLLDNKSNKSIAVPAALAQISAGIGYLAGGITHIYFPNNAVGDGYGMAEFYILWVIGYTLLTCSCGFLCLFAGRIILNKKNSEDGVKESKPTFSRVLTSRLMTTSFIGTAFSCIFIVLGCFWCLFSSDITFTDSIMDQMPNIGESPACTDLIFVGEGLWFIMFSTFTIPWSILLFNHSVKNKLNDHIFSKQPWWLGLKPSLAAILCPIVMWTIGYMYIAWVQVVVLITKHDNIALLYRDMHGAVINHLGIGLFFYLCYIVAWKLSSNYNHDMQ
ncbi:MAG: hypothetical protein AB8G05_24845 [Oligoflexales bacterium]